MASLVRGGPVIAPGKHPTADRLWADERRLVCDRCGQPLDWDPRARIPEDEIARYKANPHTWYVCGPCLNAMPDAPLGQVFSEDGEPGEIIP